MEFGTCWPLSIDFILSTVRDRGNIYVEIEKEALGTLNLQKKTHHINILYTSQICTISEFFQLFIGTPDKVFWVEDSFNTRMIGLQQTKILIALTFIRIIAQTVKILERKL